MVALDRRAFGLLSGSAVAMMLTTHPAAAKALADVFAARTAGATTTVDHSVWDRLVKAHVIPGADGVNRVAYANFKATGHKDLKAYLAALQATDPAKLDRPEQFAFWANLYNAKTIDVVLDKYPVKSIKDVSLGGGLKALVGGGPWQAKIMKVASVDLSLDDVEHQILRPIFKDPRVHYAVNCASFGCPNLPTAAFTGANLEALLDDGAKAYVNHARGISVEGGKIKASSIYSWFEADFGGSAAAVLDHARKYASPDLKAKLDKVSSIGSYDYDWSLNDVKK
jgi:hypothetical protein